MRKLLALGCSFLLLMVMVLPVQAAELAWLTVTVADATGQPLDRAEVEVYALGKGLVQVQTTQVDGTARIGYPAGSRPFWMLRVVKRGYGLAETGWFDPAARPGRMITLEPHGGQIRTLVTSPGGGRVDGQAVLIGPDGSLVANEPLVAGRMEKGGLPAGEYRLLLSGKGFAPAERRLQVGPGRMTLENTLLDLADVTVTGEIIHDKTKAPVEGARVELLRESGVVAATFTTNTTGRFRLWGPASGESYRLRVSARDFAVKLSDPFKMKGGDFADWSGENALRLSPLTGEIVGTALAATHPLRGADIVLHLQGVGEVARVKTDQEGRFQFQGLPAGPSSVYRVTVENAISYAEWQVSDGTGWVDVPPGGVRYLSLRTKGAEWPARGVGFGVVTGLVTAHEGGPLAEAKVELIRNTRVARTTTTDASGSFTFTAVDASEFGGASMGAYSLRVSKDGYIATQELNVAGQERFTFDVPSEGKAVVQATIRPQVNELVGKVVDTQGRPVAGAQVQVNIGGRPDATKVQTNDRGEYRVSRVPSELISSITISVSAPGYVATGGIDVSPASQQGGTLPNVRLTKRTSLVTGTVVDFAGRPVTGARVRALGAEGAVLGEDQSDTEGFYRLEIDLTENALPVLMVEKEGWGRAAQILGQSVQPGGRAEVDLMIQPKRAVVTGRVLDEKGQPVARTRVELLVDGLGVVSGAMTDAEGNYRIEQPMEQGPQWAWLRVDSLTQTFAGSASHGTDYVPLLRLAPGDHRVLHLQMK